MAYSGFKGLIRNLAVVTVISALLFCMSSCGAIDFIDTDDHHGGRTHNSQDHKPEGGGIRHTDVTFETGIPTGTYTSETDYIELTVDYVKSVYVYSVWYDAVDDNPADYDSIKSSNAFALKGVFYFSTPLTGLFEARLLQNNEVLLKKAVNLKNNVTAEADFSAGLEGLGTFQQGFYTVELYFDGELIAHTSPIEVK